MKRIILWRWISVAIFFAWIYATNWYAHMMSSEVDGLAQAGLTFLFLMVTYYTSKLVWKKTIKKQTK